MSSSLDAGLVSLGLYTPTRTVHRRRLAVTGALLYYIKPDSMFFDGYARPWSFMTPYRQESPDDGATIPPTTLPWWLAAALAGLLAALFL
jgi:hypothetical protein